MGFSNFVTLVKAGESLIYLRTILLLPELCTVELHDCFHRRMEQGVNLYNTCTTSNLCVAFRLAGQNES